MFNITYRGSLGDPRLTVLYLENLKILHSCQEALKEASQQYGGFAEYQTIRAELIKARAASDFATLKRLLPSYHKQIKCLKYYRWKVANQTSLADCITWNRLEAATPPTQRPCLRSLKAEYLQHGMWAHYSSRALYQVAYKILPVLVSYLALAQQEWENYAETLAPTVYRDFQAFIQELEIALHDIEHSLRAAMFARLKLAAHSGIYFTDDVLHAMVTQLQTLGALNPAMSIPEASCNLTPSLIAAFQQYITQDPSSAICDRMLHEINWLAQHPNYQLQYTHLGIYVIPKNFISLLPRSSLARWWQNWRTGLNLDHYWITRQGLMALSHGLEHPIIPATSEAWLSTVRCLYNWQQELIQEYQQLQVQLPQNWWMRWWNQLRYRILSSLKIYWEAVINKITTYQLTLLEAQLKTLAKQVMTDENKPIVIAVNSLIDSLSSCVPRLSSRNQVKLADLRYTFISWKSQLQPYGALIHEILQALENGMLQGNGRLKPLYEYADNLKLVHPQKYLKFQADFTTARKQVMRKLKVYFEQCLDLQVVMQQSLITDLLRAWHFLQQLGTADEQQQLKTALQQLLELYLTAAAQKMQAAPERWNEREALLITLLKSIQGKELQITKLEALHKLRRSDHVNWADACEAYLKTLKATVQQLPATHSNNEATVYLALSL